MYQKFSVYYSGYIILDDWWETFKKTYMDEANLNIL